MRFHLGAIPDEFTPDSSWRPIREPGPIGMQFLATPVGVATAALVWYGWRHVGLPDSARFTSSSHIWLIVSLVLSFPALVIVHELLHGVVHPRFGLTSATIIGAWPRRLLFYAHYSSTITRNRFLLVFAMPFLVISLLPLAMAALGLLPSWLLPWAAWFSIWNTLFACGDCLGIIFILCQIPSAAIVQNQGWPTYWKVV